MTDHMNIYIVAKLQKLKYKEVGFDTWDVYFLSSLSVFTQTLIRTIEFNLAMSVILVLKESTYS